MNVAIDTSCMTTSKGNKFSKTTGLKWGLPWDVRTHKLLDAYNHLSAITVKTNCWFPNELEINILPILASCSSVSLFRPRRGGSRFSLVHEGRVLHTAWQWEIHFRLWALQSAFEVSFGYMWWVFWGKFSLYRNVLYHADYHDYAGMFVYSCEDDLGHLCLVPYHAIQYSVHNCPYTGNVAPVDIDM